MRCLIDMNSFVIFQLELMNKMEQLERFNDMIGRQAARLENLIHTVNDNRENTNATSLLDESIALNAVTIAVLQNINTCVHLLAKQVLADFSNTVALGVKLDLRNFTDFILN